MIKLLRYEFYKLIKQKSLYICGGIMLALLIANIGLSKLLSVANLEEFGFSFDFSGADMMLQAVTNSSFTLVWSIFAALFACGDFTNQTVKSVYSRGFSRPCVYFAKYIVLCVATVAVYALTIIFGLAFGSAFFNAKAAAGNYAGLLAGQLLACIAYTTAIFSLCYIIRKTGPSVALAIVGSKAITIILALLDAVMKLENFALSDYWLDGILVTLSSLETSAKYIWIDVALSVVYTSAFFVLGYFVDRNRDI